MIINHNIDALAAYNKINAAGKTKANAMEKLSSGLRINTASDDAAGSAISQKMKAQIRGLDQADRNIQDGISLVQTAEAGLGSIQDPNLLRMRDLILQASNGTLTQEDREKIQNELDSIKAGIDDIANNTEFNTIKVLALPIKEVTEAPPVQQQSKLDLVFMVDKSGSMYSPLGGGNSAIGTMIDGIGDFLDNMSAGIDTKISIVNITDDSDYTPLSNDKNVILQGLNSNKTTGITSPYNLIERSVPNGDIGKQLGYREDSKKVFVIFTDAPNEINPVDSGENAKNAVEGAVKVSGYDNDDIQTFVFGMNDGNYGNTVQVIKNAFQNITDTTGGEIYNPSTSDEIPEKLNNDLIQDIKSVIEPTIPPSIQEEMPILQLQVGANSGQQFQVELFDARTKNLGMDDISVNSLDEAEKALEKVDNAIDVVSKQRSKFGAYQNALEHIGNNVGNYSYNITSAESRISDSDMAKEVMEMSKSSIIEESAQSILQQAEKMPQSIIDLISKWQG